MMQDLAALFVSWGPLGLFLVALLDSAGIPLPAGVDAFIVTLSVMRPERAYFLAILALIGSLIGSMILYYLARRGGQRYLNRYTISGRGAKFKVWFLKYGLITVFVPAFLPIPLPLKVFVICAGALGVRPSIFLVVMLTARIPRYFGLAILGAELGGDSAAFLRDHASLFLLAAVGLTIALTFFVKFLNRYRTVA